MQAILCTIQESQVSKGYFISLYDDFGGQSKGLAPVSFYLVEQGLQDLRIKGDFSMLEWLKDALEFISALQNLRSKQS